MKKFLIAIIIIILFFGAFIPFMLSESLYCREAVVTEANEDTVTVEDICGYIWIFEGKGFKKGMKVELKMTTNHTDMDLTDDKILKVRIK